MKRLGKCLIALSQFSKRCAIRRTEKSMFGLLDRREGDKPSKVYPVPCREYHSSNEVRNVRLEAASCLFFCHPYRSTLARPRLARVVRVGRRRAGSPTASHTSLQTLIRGHKICPVSRRLSDVGSCPGRDLGRGSHRFQSVSDRPNLPAAVKLVVAAV